MKARKALSEIKVYNGARTCWVDNNGKCRGVYVRTNDDFNSNGKWHDAAVVEYETGAQVAHAANPEKQMGYVRVRATVEVAGECYLFARWYTEHHSLTSFRSGMITGFHHFWCAIFLHWHGTREPSRPPIAMNYCRLRAYVNQLG